MGGGGLVLATNDMQCAGQGWGGDPSSTRVCREEVVMGMVVVVVKGEMVLVRKWARRARMSLEMVRTAVQELTMRQRLPFLMQQQGGHGRPRAWWLKESAVHHAPLVTSDGQWRWWMGLTGGEGDAEANKEAGGQGKGKAKQGLSLIHI